MKWTKRSLIYVPTGTSWWAKSYAILPTAEVISRGVIRVYFAALDADKFGRIGYVDLDAADPERILAESKEPILDLGTLGAFDDSGVTPCCVVNLGPAKYLYYMGWQRCQRVPYMLFAGLAISRDGGPFERVSRVPVLDRTNEEPFLRSTTAVINEEGIFKAWYTSGQGWTVVDGMQYPTYVIRSAESPDGIHWVGNSQICIDLKNDHEFGLSRPWVVREKDVYKMWYSIRSRNAPYQMGYAESANGVEWVRKDAEVGIERSATGWDSEMICYPCVVKTSERQYLFYNGNRHGSTGFGCAVLEP